MTLALTYPDTATFVVVTSGTYANSKTMAEQVEVPVIFLQDTNFQHAANQDGITADSVCYVDPFDAWILSKNYRLEGMYIVAAIFGEETWYKIESVTVNRDHLLGNVVDNVELLLKKSTPIPGVS